MFGATESGKCMLLDVCFGCCERVPVHRCRGYVCYPEGDIVFVEGSDLPHVRDVCCYGPQDVLVIRMFAR